MKKWAFILGIFTFVNVSSFESRLELHANPHMHLYDGLIKQMIDLFEVDVLIETGTLNGANAGNAAKWFKEVHTVELSRKCYEDSVRNLKKYRNVVCYFGDSSVLLSTMIQKAHGKILFWLDAHYSGGNTAGENKDPLLDEIVEIGKSGQYENIILIDDIRGHPAHQIYQELIKIDDGYVCLILGDIMLAYNKKYYSPKVSPLVQACTVSRISSDIAQVINAEKQIIAIEPSVEKDKLTELARQFPGGYYSLWKGLSNIGLEDYASAISSFQKCLNFGPYQWRIMAYLVKAYYENGDFNSAENSFQALAPFIETNEKEIRSILGDYVFDMWRVSFAQTCSNWPYGRVCVVGDSHAAFCFTIAKSWEDHLKNEMPKEVVLNNINDVTYRVPWIVNWIGPYTMNRIGRDGFDSSFFLQGQMMLL